MAYAVVTGAGSGIGRAVARAFAARGLDVALLGRHAADLEETRAMISQVRAECFACDVSSESSVMDRPVRSLPRLRIATCGCEQRGCGRAKECGRNDIARMATRSRHQSDGNLPRLARISACDDREQNRTDRVNREHQCNVGDTSSQCLLRIQVGGTGFSKSLPRVSRHRASSAHSASGSVDTAMLEGSGFPPEMTPEHVANVVVYASLDAPDAMNGSSVEVFGP